ncbi:hypothetical protein L1987_52529 [Smallanthus sonchifolius]|uniref:Uncharacterized protein n=1 Tax=Smallanthus sonchifolius TaxID=185202 RepID=A0ACB9ETR7_9ASTR|nr:hypothetical protein L1987_52529 [Smallanthus sonchifolius]
MHLHLGFDAEFQFAVLAIVKSLNGVDINGTVAYEALEVISLLAKMKQNLNSTYSPWSFLAEFISNMEPLMCLLANGSHSVQDKSTKSKLLNLLTSQSYLLGGAARMWLLSILSSFSEKNKRIVVVAGGLEVLSDKLANYTTNSQTEFEDTEKIWITALLMALSCFKMKMLWLIFYAMEIMN